MKCWFLIFVAVATSTTAVAQDPSATDEWEFSTDLNFYFIPDQFVLLPVVRADRNKLHLEARYNYEDLETISIWAGYNFSGGKDLTFMITPMGGAVLGMIDGFAAGVELTLAYGSVELYSESEYFIDPSLAENNFFYTWTDVTFSPLEWLWVGISAQKTRLYQTERDVQRGLILGGGWRRWEATGYVYNPDETRPVFILTISASF